MTDLAVGERVVVDDPLGYTGPGVVQEVQQTPTEAVYVLLDDRETATWVMTCYVRGTEARGGHR